MYFKPDFSLASLTAWQSSSVMAAGTAVTQCLPCFITSTACRAWLGASVARQTASIAGSFTSTSSES